MTLTEICRSLGARGSDKGNQDHMFKGESYLEVYASYFEKKRDEKIKFLEIGVLGGGSLRMWRKYFTAADIVGVDINPGVVAPPGTTVVIGDQSNHNFMRKVSDEMGPFNIVIDDGSHIIKHSISAFEAIWPLMPPKSIYAIEDTRMFYVQPLVSMPGMKYNAGLKEGQEYMENDRSEFDQFILSKVHDIDWHRGDVRRIGIHPMQIVFQKV
jgi:hypothetical protein